DGTLLVWDLPPAKHLAASSGKKLGPDDLVASWKDLASDNAVTAYRALWKMVDNPTSSVPFLNDHLRPAESKDLDKIKHLIKNLDDDKFSVRQEASRELERMGDFAEPAIRQALDQTPSAEVRR